MGKLFAITLAIIALASVALIAAHIWWMPVDISAHGPAIDSLMAGTIGASGVLFLAAQLLLALFAWQYGEPNREGANERKIKTFPGGPAPLVVAAMLVVGIEVVTLTFVGSKVWSSIYMSPAPPHSLAVDVQAEQFAFYFRYAGPDGKFGAIHPELINDSIGNFFGLDTQNDPAAKDDIVTDTLAVPVGRPILLTLHSQDVGHSFYVRELRIQQDFVPGLLIPVHFTALKTGKFEIVCTQLCGLGHYSMRSYLQVMSQGDYDAWLKARAAGQ